MHCVHLILDSIWFFECMRCGTWPTCGLYACMQQNSVGWYKCDDAGTYITTAGMVRKKTNTASKCVCPYATVYAEHIDAATNHHHHHHQPPPCIRSSMSIHLRWTKHSPWQSAILNKLYTQPSACVRWRWRAPQVHRNIVRYALRYWIEEEEEEKIFHYCTIHDKIMSTA